MSFNNIWLIESHRKRLEKELNQKFIGRKYTSACYEISSYLNSHPLWREIFGVFANIAKSDIIESIEIRSY